MLKHWEDWLLWRMVGKRAEAFVAAKGWSGPLSKSMLEAFFEMDNFMDRMEAQKIKKELQKGSKNAR